MGFKPGNTYGIAGKPKGLANKMTREVKAVFAEVFEGCGGANAFIRWVKKSNENRKEFYKMYSKQLPVDISLNEGAQVKILLTTKEENL
jgi:hypothetical protein